MRTVFYSIYKLIALKVHLIRTERLRPVEMIFILNPSSLHKILATCLRQQ